MKLFNIYIILISSILVTSTFAQTNTWNGNTDTDWHKPCNWSLNAVPTCNHDVIIPTGTANKPVITAIAHAKTLDVQGSVPSTLTITGSGTIDVTTCSGSPTVNGGCCTPPSALSVIFPTINPSNISETCTGYYQVSSAGATSYTWSVSSDASIVAGQGTNTADVSFNIGSVSTTQTVTVSASNACGSTASYTFNVNVDVAPAQLVVGETMVGQGTCGFNGGQFSEVYEGVVGAAGYAEVCTCWTGSPGAAGCCSPTYVNAGDVYRYCYDTISTVLTAVNGYSSGINPVCRAQE